MEFTTDSIQSLNALTGASEHDLVQWLVTHIGLAQITGDKDSWILIRKELINRFGYES